MGFVEPQQDHLPTEPQPDPEPTPPAEPQPQPTPSEPPTPPQPQQETSQSHNPSPTNHREPIYKDYSMIQQVHMETAGATVSETQTEGQIYQDIFQEIATGQIPLRPIGSDPIPNKLSIRGIDNPTAWVETARRWIRREWARNERKRDDANQYNSAFYGQLHKDYVEHLRRGLFNELDAQPEVAEDIQDIVRHRLMNV